MFVEDEHIMFDAVEPIIFALSEYIMLRSNISFFCEAKDNMNTGKQLPSGSCFIHYF